MSEIRVNVEGAPEAVAKFFKEMGQTQFISGKFPSGLMGEYVSEDTPPLSRIKDFGVDTAKEGSEKTVVVEIKNGEEEVVEVCPVEVYQIKEEKKTRKPRQKKEDKVEVTEEAPDPEFEGVPGEDSVVEAEVVSHELEVDNTEPSEATFPEESHSLPEVKEALKEYGLWVVEMGHESHSAKEYLVALLRKYGRVEASKDLDAEGRNAVFNAAVNRVPMEELEEFK